MQPTTTSRIRRIACTAGLALTAVVAFAAAGSGANLDPSEQRALLIRSKALNCKHARADACMTSAEYRALMLRSEALNRKYGLGEYRKH